MMKQFVSSYTRFSALIKNNKLILLLVVIVIGFLFIFFVFLNDQVFDSVKKEDNTQAPTQSSLPLKFSRITFFHADKPICTLAIPENWEGKYRLRDSGDVAHFLYIQDVGSPEIFYIKKYKKNKNIASGELVIQESKDYIYVANLSTGAVDGIVDKVEFNKMVKDFTEISKTFRCF